MQRDAMVGKTQKNTNYFEAKVSLEEKTQRTELVQQLESSGLKETVNPTKVIRIKKEKQWKKRKTYRGELTWFIQAS